MFRHVVLLRFDHGAPDGHAEQVARQLRTLPALVPSLRSYEVGVDVRLADDNAHVAVVAAFDDESGYDTYRDHPEHRRIITELILPHLQSRTASQFHDATA